MQNGSLKIILAILVTIAVIAGIAYLIVNKTVDALEKKAVADSVGNLVGGTENFLNRLPR